MHRITVSLNILFSLLILTLSAKILADVASDRLLSLTSTTTTTAKNVALPSVPTSLQSYAIILEKGLLGQATRGPLTPLNKQAVSAAAPAISQTDLMLLGTVTGSPRESFILLRRTSSNEERVFRQGERVFDLGTLIAVHKESADIKTNNQLIVLRTPTSPAEPQKPVAPNGAPAPVTGGVIQPITGNVGIIDQRALNAALDNIGQAMTDARLLPSVKDGKVEGFKLSEVKPQGVFGALGLKNGDVLARINDFPVDSPEKAIQSFMTLKGQNRIKLDLIRDGAATSLTYDIR